MITCPNCKASLPDWAKNCQFCQTDTAQVLRPKQQAPNARTFDVPTWVWAAYYAICTWMLVDPAITAAKILLHQSKDGLGFFQIIVLVFVSAQMLVALGLLFRVQFVRSFVNFFCWVGIFFGLMDLVFSFGATLVLGGWGVLLILYTVFRLVMYGMMIYLIGETDKASY